MVMIRLYCISNNRLLCCAMDSVRRYRKIGLNKDSQYEHPLKRKHLSQHILRVRLFIKINKVVILTQVAPKQCASWRPPTKKLQTGRLMALQKAPHHARSRGASEHRKSSRLAQGQAKTCYLNCIRIRRG